MSFIFVKFSVLTSFDEKEQLVWCVVLF